MSLLKIVYAWLLIYYVLIKPFLIFIKSTNMKSSLFTLVIFVFMAIPLISCGQSKQSDFDLSLIDPGSYDGTWWNRTPIRLTQTNFPAIHASMDVNDYVQTLLDASANAVLFNTGGIVASYQTQLPLQYKNPHMGTRDFVGDLIT